MSSYNYVHPKGTFNTVCFVDHEANSKYDGLLMRNTLQCSYFCDNTPEKDQKVNIELENNISLNKSYEINDVSSIFPFLNVDKLLRKKPSTKKKGKEEDENESELDLDELVVERKNGLEYVLPSSYKSYSPIKKMLAFLGRHTFANLALISHNGGKFDQYFILDELLLHQYIPHVILEGNTIRLINLTDLNITIVDSLRYISCSLEKFETYFDKSFGDRTKGIYPYKFNKPQNYTYENIYPSADNYLSFASSEKQIEKVHEFLKSKQGQTFHAFEDLVQYCITDTLVLVQGMCAFIKEFFEAQNELNTVMPIDYDEEYCKHLHPIEGSLHSAISAYYAIFRSHSPIWSNLYSLKDPYG